MQGATNAASHPSFLHYAVYRSFATRVSHLKIWHFWVHSLVFSP